MRTYPWETGFVDLAGGQGVLGQVDGRSTAAVRGWLAQRSAEFGDAVPVVVIDPHVGYARAVRELLPHGRLARGRPSWRRHRRCVREGEPLRDMEPTVAEMLGWTVWMRKFRCGPGTASSANVRAGVPSFWWRRLPGGGVRCGRLSSGATQSHPALRRARRRSRRAAGCRAVPG